MWLTLTSSGGAGTPGRSALMRRLFLTTGVLAVLLIAVVVYVWIQGGNEAPISPIAEAAVRTQQVPGAKTLLHATARGQSGSRPIEMSGRGVFNGQTSRSELKMTAHAPTGDLKMEAVASGSHLYFRSKAFQSGLPPGDEWLGLDASLGTSSKTAAPANSDPSAQLDLLRAVSDEFETLGKKKIHGVQTTGYRSTLDPDSYAGYLRGKGSVKTAEQYEQIARAAPSTTEAETWIDGRGLVRRMTMKTDSHDPKSGKAMSMEMTMDFYDFGISPDIELPDPDTVYDATNQVRSELGVGNSS